MILGYIYVILGVLAGSTKGGVSKLLSGSVKSSADNLFVNAVRMLLCTCIGFVAVIVTGNGFAVTWEGLLISLLSAVSFSAFVVIWMECVKTGALVMIDIFLTAGVAIPMIGGILLLDEAVRPIQWIGFLILILGVAIICGYNNSIKGRMSAKLLFLLILLGMSNGFASLAQKMFVELCAGTSTFVFNFYTYLFSMVILGVPLIFKPTVFVSNVKKPKLMLGIFIVAVCLYLNLMFKMFAGMHLSTAQIYPLCQGLGIVNSSIIASVFFGEKINHRAILGMLVSFVALLMINLL